MTKGVDEAERDAYDLMSRGYHRAAVAVGMLVRQLAIGPHIIELRFAGDALLQRLMPALEHLVCFPASDESPAAPANAAPDLVVELWDSISTGTEVSPLITWVIDMARREPFETLTPRQEVRRLNTPRVHTVFELGSAVLSMFDSATRTAVYWAEDAAALPYYELGAPLRTIINWSMQDRALHCVHAAAVGDERGVVLLAGRGGSGKSTSALACLGSELQYLSDDYCVVDLSGEPLVHSLYNTGKLGGAIDLERQPRFAPWVVNPQRRPDEKLLMFLHRHVPEQIRTSGSLKAIVLPVVTGRTQAAISPVSSGAALRALAPTTMFQLPGAREGSFHLMAELVRSVPCFTMETGSDLASIPGALGALLENLALPICVVS